MKEKETDLEKLVKELDRKTSTKKIKTRIDVECCCTTCGMYFTINDFLMHFNMKEPGGGYYLSGMECPGCGLNRLDFDFMVVEEIYPIKKVVEFRRKDKNKLGKMPK